MKQLLWEHPGVAITLGVTYFAFLGILYQYFLLDEFGINSFYYVTSNDFILAFFRSTPYMGLVVLVHIVIWLLATLGLFHLQPKDSSNEGFLSTFVRLGRMELIVIALFLPPLAIATGMGHGRGFQYNALQCRSILSTSDPSTPIYEGDIIDTSINYLFVIDANHQVAVINRDQISQIVPCNFPEKK